MLYTYLLGLAHVHMPGHEHYVELALTLPIVVLFSLLASLKLAENADGV